MRIEFQERGCPGRSETEDHIRDVYRSTYSAEIHDFAPLLIAARRTDGAIMCAAGLRTEEDGFFSERYLDSDVSHVLRSHAGITAPRSEIMEVVSLASRTPFPVLPMMDTVIRWGRARGMTCGVFTATKPLRRLLKRTGMAYSCLASADINRTEDPKIWGNYYYTDPWVCAFSETAAAPHTLSPRRNALEAQSEVL